LARGRLEGDWLVVSEVVLGSEVGSVTDTVATIAGDTLITIDAPFGCPMPHGHALREHRAGGHHRDGAARAVPAEQTRVHSRER
jgi:hypothetical protein